MASIWPVTPRIMNLDTTVMEKKKKKKKSSVFLCGLQYKKLKLFTCPKNQIIKAKDEEISRLKSELAEKNAEAERWKELYLKQMDEEIKSPSSPAIMSTKALQGNKTAGPHRKLKLKPKLFKCRRKVLRKLILIKAKDNEISNLNAALAEKDAEARKFKELYLKRGEEIKSLKLAKAEKENNCGSTSSSDNHLKSSGKTLVYDQKRSDKPWYDEQYVSGHHTDSNPAAG